MRSDSCSSLNVNPGAVPAASLKIPTTMKLINLSFSSLVKTMHSILRAYDYSAQRDALLDIASLWDIAQGGRCFTRYWGVRLDGAHLSIGASRSFGIWDGQIEACYRISFSPAEGWAIEELPD